MRNHVNLDLCPFCTTKFLFDDKKVLFESVKLLLNSCRQLLQTITMDLDMIEQQDTYVVNFINLFMKNIEVAEAKVIDDSMIVI